MFSPYVVLAGPPNNADNDVASPSPINVLCNPGSLMKSSSHVAPIAHISPICSIIVAMAIGIIVVIAKIIAAVFPKSTPPKTVCFT